MNDKIEKMKEEYMEIKASDALKERLEKTMKDNNNSKNKMAVWKKLSTVAACFIAVIVMSLNVNQALAASISDLPGMSGIVNVLTFGRYVVDEGGFQANIETPKIEGLLDKELEEKLNRDFKDNSETLILAFENDMKSLKEEFPGEEVHMGVDSGYIVKTDNETILAIDVYMVNTVGSSSTTHKFYTVDKKTNELLTLPSLFKKDSDYVQVLSEYIKGEMIRQNQTEENLYWIDDEMGGSFEKIKENQNFYINEDGNIVIGFDKYEVGPGSSGCPEFVIPNDVVKDILK